MGRPAVFAADYPKSNNPLSQGVKNLIPHTFT